MSAKQPESQCLLRAGQRNQADGNYAKDLHSLKRFVYKYQTHALGGMISFSLDAANIGERMSAQPFYQAGI